MTPGRRVGSTAAVLAAALVSSRIFPQQLPMGTLVYGALYGALSGLLAIGLVVTFRVTRTINFAYGAMGGAAASVGVTAFLGHGWPWLVCVAVSVVLGGFVGILVGALITWRFATAPRLVVTVATIGLAQLFGGLAVLTPQWLGGPDQLFGGFRTPLSGFNLSISPVLFTGNDVLVLVLVPVTVAGISWALLRTHAGAAVRAIADNGDRVRLLGVPARRLLLATWALCGAVAGLAAILQAPSQGVALNASGGPTLLLAPLAAAVIARMESLPTAFGAAVGLGVLQSVVGLNAEKQSIQTVVLLGVVVLALLLQPRRALRGDDEGEGSWAGAGLTQPLPGAVRQLVEVRIARTAFPALAIGAALLLPRFLRPDQVNQATSAIVFALAALSLVILSGWGGTVSLAQTALVGVGAVAAGNVMMRFNLDLLQSLAIGGAAGGVVAVLLGVPALRVRGHYLAVTTLAFAVAADQFFFNPSNFADQLPTDVVRPVLWKRFDLADESALYYFSLGILVITVGLIVTVRRVRPGRALLSVRDNPRGAEAAAIPILRTKLMSFVAAGVIAGVAGGLNVVNFGSVSFGAYPAAASLLVFSAAVIGGLNSVLGVLASALAIQWLGVALPTWQVLLTGVGVVVILTILPTGVAGIGIRVRDKFAFLLAQGHGLDTSVWSEGASDEQGVADSIRAGGATDVLDPVLSCHQLEASYGSLQVLFGVDLEVGRGEIVALLGTNGAGKSSVLRCLAGLMKIDRGELEVNRSSVVGWTPERMANNGVALVPGGRGVFPSLTVAENLDVARWLLRHDPDRESDVRGRIDELFPALDVRRTVRAGDLSGGEQQMLSIAMALLSDPEVLCIDELSLGLSPAMVAKLVEAVKAINAEGTTVLIVEQSISTACEVAERAVFLEKGRVRFTGPTEDLRDRPDLLRAVFLPDPDHSAPSRAGGIHGSADVVLACEGLRKSFGGVTAVDGVSLRVRAGEVLGLVGHNGAGKTTLFDVLSGFITPDAGTFILEDLDLTDHPAHIRSLAGLGRSFQEAKLFPALTVHETVLVAMERHLVSRDLVAAMLALPASTDSEAVAAAEADRIISLLGLEAYRDKLTSALSTGTRRVVELACVLAQRPSVLLLDEPSGGVAQAESGALVALLRRVAAETGCSVVIIEHDMGIMGQLCDRLIALESGRVIAEGTPLEVLNHPDVIASYLGQAPSSADAASDAVTPPELSQDLTDSASASASGPDATVVDLKGALAIRHPSGARFKAREVLDDQ